MWQHVRTLNNVTKCKKFVARENPVCPDPVWKPVKGGWLPAFSLISLSDIWLRC